MPDLPNPAAPDIQQSGGPLAVSPIPEAFGASVAGQGLQQQGQAEGQASDVFSQRALQLQQINNQNAADSATQTYAANNAQAIESYKQGLLKSLSENPGLDTQSYLANFLKEREAARSEVASNMTNLAAREMFDQDSRRVALITASSMAGETSAAWKQSTEETSKGSIQLNQSLAIAGNGDLKDPNVLGAFMSIHNSVKSLAQLKGLGPDAQAALLQASVSPVYEKLFLGKLDTGDFNGASQILADHAAHDLTPDALGQMQRMLKTGFINNSVKTPVSMIYDQGVAPIVPGMPPGVQDSRGFFKTFVAQHEGSQTVIDSNGAPVQYGINKADHPDADVGNLNLEQAADIYQTYTRPDLQGPISNIYGDTAFMSGKAEADKLLQESGGDPNKYIDLREAYQAKLAQDNPEKYSRYAAVWLHRSEDLRATALGTGSTAAFNEPPPKFAPSADPADIRDEMLQYNIRAANALFPNNAVQREAFLRDADSRANLQANIANDHQLTLYNQAESWLREGLPNGNAVHSIQDIPPSMLASLAPSYRNRLTDSINLANQGIGAFKTPEMESNANYLIGLSGTNPGEFANKDLSKYRLSGADWKTLASTQASFRRQDESKDQRVAEFQSLSSNPIVKQIITKQFEQDGQPGSDTKPTPGGAYVASDAHLAFLGALQGEVQNAQAKRPNQPLSEQDIGTIANNLIATMGPKGPQAYMVIPPQDKLQIQQAYVKNYGRLPNPEEIAYLYHRGLNGGK